MNVVNALSQVTTMAYVKTGNAFRYFAKANPGVMLMAFGALLMAAPMGVDAQTVSTVAGSLTQTIKDLVSFVMNIGVIVGVLAIMYGVKLVIDKSNERENVKNSHIVVSFVGGAMMCMLWFVVRMMTNTVGSEGGAIGEAGSW